MTHSYFFNIPAALVLLFTLAACAETTDEASSPAASEQTEAWPDKIAPDQLITEVSGFSGPEAVRYDPDQDVYFVGNFNGGGMDMDNNGFISRLGPDGSVEQIDFIAGGANGVTLHAPRGMTITGDTLWAADVDAVRGFNRHNGAPLATIDFSDIETGFLNDVTPGPDGSLYVTDTGKNRVYHIAGGEISIALEDETLARPNGITWNAAANNLIIVPYGGPETLFTWQPGSTALQPFATSPGAKFDGVEVLSGGRLLVASQADSSLHLVVEGQGRPFVRTGGAPADIGVDTKRNRVAVPFIARNLVEIWQLPQ